MHGKPLVSLIFSVALMIAACSIPLHAGESPAAPIASRIRILDPTLRVLLEEGVTRSPELRSLVDALTDSDLLVYVVGADCRPRAEACLMLTFADTRVRYLRIHVPVGHDGDERLAYLGHELRHATEVAARTDVRSDRQMERMYRRIGIRSCRGLPRCYDTEAAREAGVRVLRELQSTNRPVSH